MIVVTGATGFMGRYLVRRLLADSREKVVALARFSSRTFASDGLEWRLADLTDFSSVVEATKGATTVCHTAALVPGTGTARDMEKVNAEGTAHLVRACERNGIHRFVHISSVAVYAPPLAATVLENHAVGGMDNYGRTKSQAESCVASSSLEWLILRPCQVYGYGDRSGYTAMLMRLLRSPILPVSASGGFFSLVHVEDLADAVRLACFSRATGHALNITGPRPTSLSILARVHDEQFGYRRLSVPVPTRIIRSALSLRWSAKALLRKGAMPLFRSYAPEFTHGSIFLGGPDYDVSFARGTLDYNPRIGEKEGVLSLGASPSSGRSSHVVLGEDSDGI